MIQYTLRPGVVTATLCGQFILIPTRKLAAVCDSVQVVPPRWAPLVKMIEHQEPMERIYSFYQRVFTNPPEEVNRTVDYILDKLAENGFLLRAGSEAGHE